MGAAALALVYVASGRFDAYIESGISLWDIAAGGLILECAGGEFWHRSLPNGTPYRMIANNGLLRGKLERLARAARKSGAVVNDNLMAGQGRTAEDSSRVAGQRLLS